MVAIPKRLLPHQIVYEEYTGTVNSKPTYAKAETIYNVRVEPIYQYALSSLGDAKNDRFTIIYDAKNSVPKFKKFVAKSRITFGDIVLTVRTATPFYDSKRLHHWEVNCV